MNDPTARSAAVLIRHVYPTAAITIGSDGVLDDVVTVRWPDCPALGAQTFRDAAEVVNFLSGVIRERVKDAAAPVCTRCRRKIRDPRAACPETAGVPCSPPAEVSNP